MDPTRILIVEDEPKILALLRDYLTQAGFAVTLLGSGHQVVETVRKDPPDLLLLDLMLPEKDGLTICREIRAFSALPIIMITAKIEEIDRLLGLELGADDYICKPFSPREVVARVKAVLRRTVAPVESEVLTVGSIALDNAAHQVTINDRPLVLTPNEFALLKIMMARPGFVFSRSDLIAKVQGYDFDGYDRTIDSHIKNLRKKIADHLPGIDVIQTVYGVGYTFQGPPVA